MELAMKEFDHLQQKIDTVLTQYKTLNQDHLRLVKQYEQVLKEKEKLEQKNRQLQLRIDDLVLQSTCNTLTDEQKAGLKIQLAAIIERIDQNLKML